MIDGLRCSLTKLLELDNHSSKLQLRCVLTQAFKLTVINHLGVSFIEIVEHIEFTLHTAELVTA